MGREEMEEEEEEGGEEGGGGGKGGEGRIFYLSRSVVTGGLVGSRPTATDARPHIPTLNNVKGARERSPSSLIIQRAPSPQAADTETHL